MVWLAPIKLSEFGGEGYVKQLWFIKYRLDLLLHLLIKKWRAPNQTFLHQEGYIADVFTPNPMVILFFFDTLTVDF